MEIDRTKLKDYFLDSVSPSEAEEIELQIIEDEQFSNELEDVELGLMESYLQKTLTAKEIELFESNYLVTIERKDRLEFLRLLKDFAQNNSATVEFEEKPPNFFESLKNLFIARQFAFGAGGLALILAVGISSYFVWKNYSTESEVLASLNKAYKNDRPTEARITDFDYAPKSEGTRGGQKTENLDLVLAKSRAAESVLKKETAENLHELGRVYLAENNFDEAIKQFEKAVKLNANIAKIHNDLGVAYLEKGKLKPEGGLEFFAKANEEIEKAIELDGNLTEAYFNRGLIIESLKLPNQAKQAWENYLQRDSISPWAEEARKHLQNLEKTQPIGKTKEEILQEFLQAKQSGDHEKAWQTLSKNREMITGKLIPQQLAFLFVDAKSEGNEAKANEALNNLNYVGELEIKKSGDVFWKESAKYYESFGTDQIVKLKQAQDAIRKGYDFCLKSNFEDGRRAFEEASKYFSDAANKIELNLSLHLTAYCLTQSDKVKESLKIRQAVNRECEANNFIWMKAVNAYREGNDLIVLRQFSKAESAFRVSANLSRQIEDKYMLQRNLLELADISSYFGQVSQSISNLQNVFELADGIESSPRQNWRNLTAAVIIFSNAKLSKTAQIYGNEIIKIGDEMNDPIFMTSSRLYVGQLLLRSNDYENSKIHLRDAVNKADGIVDEELKNNRIAAAYLYLGNLERAAGNYRDSIKYYQDALDIYAKKQWSFDVFETQKGLLLANKAINNESEIERQIPLLIGLVNNNRQEILSEQQRNSFFDIEQDIYDIAIDYEVSKARAENAFDYSEESRSRSLFDLQNSGADIVGNGGEIHFLREAVNPLKLAEIQTKLPENVQLLQYAVLDDKVVIWLVSNNNLVLKTTVISANELKTKVTEFVEQITQNGDLGEQKKASESLYQTLILPIKDSLDKEKEVVIIPDKFLFHLPFSALFLGKYLIEDYKLSFAPSVNVFLFCSKKAELFKSERDENILSVGNPAIDKTIFENLQNLPSAEKEAAEIAKFYQNSSVLSDISATKSAIQSNLNNNDVIHFAGHYLVDEKSSLLSGLVVAGKNAEDSVLSNYEIIGGKLTRPRLVVLSACQTGIEKYYNGEGMIGASRAFLATGIPIIIATQWQVESQASAKLMIDFHRLRKVNKLSTVNALREAQLEMIRSENYRNPYNWAAFLKLGGYAEF